MRGKAKAGVAKRGLLLVVATAALLTFLPASAGAAVPDLLVKVPEDGQQGAGAGQTAFLSGIAADPNFPGHIYVLDGNDRISEFTPWGEFVKAFGWKVNAASPEEKLQACTTASGCQKGTDGIGAGQFDDPRAIAVDSEGNVYVAEGPNHRIQKFSSEGEFLLAWGGDVVAHGPDDSTNDEQQLVTVAASSGSFKLKFENPLTGGGTQETASLPFNATAAEVKAALNALSTIGGLGGSVSVSGGPGNPTGSTPYTVTFEGNLGGDDVPQISIDRSALGPASIGATLRCSAIVEVESIEYRWLRNGALIPGAESSSYTTVAADEGKSVQCRATAKSGNGAAIGAATPVYVAPPEGVTAPPVLKERVVAQTDFNTFLTVGSTGGQKLLCDKGTWSGADSFAYSWYRNGVQIAGAVASTYIATEADLVSPAYFQCAVTASNAGTATTTKFSVHGISSEPVTNPNPSPPIRLPEVRMDPPSSVFTSHQGGAPEVCKPGDACKAGVASADSGYLGAERYDQKLAISPVDDSVFVAEPGRLGEDAHIQVFDPDGSFGEEIALPKSPASIATDDEGKVYVGFINNYQEGKFSVNEGEVRKLEPTGPSAEFLKPSFVVPKAESQGMGGIAVDSAGNLYAVTSGVTNQSTKGHVLEFDPSGKCVNCGTAGEGGKAGFDRSTESEIRGLAVGSACGSDDVYAAHVRSVFPAASFLNFWGDPPDVGICPPPAQPPQIVAQYAISVDTDTAEVQAQINPEFWPDTRYYLEYGTAPCFEGSCTAKPASPGALLTKKTTKSVLQTATITLEGLEPGTTYHYRFVAQSGGGGPVLGPLDKAEASFTTSQRGEASPCPANEAFRQGPAALLPDCRGYEMVSPLDKENGDIVVLGEITSHLPATLNQSSTGGDRLVYGSLRSFAGAESAPWTTQYLAARGEGGWLTHPISPPRGRLILPVGRESDTELKALSPDLCESWWRTVAEPALAPGAIVGYPNLYRRTDEECGGRSWEPLSLVKPSNVEGRFYFRLELQGRSDDGATVVYGANDSLPGTEAPPQPESCADPDQALSCQRRVYLQRRGEALPHYVCILPSGAGVTGDCGAGRRRSDDFRSNSYLGALSANGQRVFWSTGGFFGGSIYLRENPAQPESAHSLGEAKGTGDLAGPVTALGNLGKSLTSVKKVKPQSGGTFVVGQEITAPEGIAAGTTITKVEEPEPGVFTLTLSKAATLTKTESGLTGIASAVVSNAKATSGAFAVGQEISALGGGIPTGTTIAKVEAGKLTLSAKATRGGAGAGLASSSKCTEAEKACTIAVSRKAEALSGNEEGSVFAGAAADGSKALFTIGAQTTDLYEFDVDTEATTLIAHKVRGMLGVSRDASYVYFTSEEVLSGANPQGKSPVAGGHNLYRYHEGDYSLVATLASADSGINSVEPDRHTGRVTSDGLHAVFMSSASLTGYDNVDARSGKADAEVYLYDATANGGGGELLCASCNPSGARPNGEDADDGGASEDWIAARTPVFENSLYGARVLAEDGNRLFFEAADALTPRDTNGVLDVYQWEVPGTGGCEVGGLTYSPSNGGCIDLISSGQSPKASQFVDASLDGNDVFFTTLASLDGQDNGLVDVYDARVGGGFPEPEAAAPQCEGEACQSAPEAPNDPTPASESFEGAGNVRQEPQALAPKPCAKGKVRRKGKCVKKSSRKAAKRAKHERRAGR